MNHTFLFQEGVWVASGFYMDEKNQLIPVGGEATISHQEDIWFNQSRMRVLLEKPIEFQNNYEIVPFGPDGSFTTWTSLTLLSRGSQVSLWSLMIRSCLSFNLKTDNILVSNTCED